MWPNPHFPADLVTFTEEILDGKLHFLCSDLGLKSLENFSNFSRFTKSDTLLAFIIIYYLEGGGIKAGVKRAKILGK